ncbi:MAG: FAD-dependent oxidoreductase [Gammaproteobacteria bacterium]|nr:FAD-dependent oxidoreductase [Gammaproteobacteria bacterium]
MTRRSLSVDAAIVGGGISGLWIANLLAERGLSVVVCEARGVGGEQTLASQGIVHGGVKYTLDGTAPLVSALEAMPNRWRACLGGEGEVDLRGVDVLAERVRFHRGPETLDLDDFVLDVPALVRHLAEGVAERIAALAVGPESLVPGGGGIEQIELDACTIRARVYVFAAGAGNEALAKRAGFVDVNLRHRPLRQTVVRLRRHAGIFAHWAPACETEPTLTVTSHGALLSVGGKVADAGANRDEACHVRDVRALLREGFPALDLADAGFATFVAVRAEPTADAIRDIPDAFVARHGNCLTCLPVKLSLAPRLGDLVLAELDDLEPGRATWQGNPNAGPVYAPSPYSC